MLVTLCDKGGMKCKNKISKDEQSLIYTLSKIILCRKQGQQGGWLNEQVSKNLVLVLDLVYFWQLLKTRNRIRVAIQTGSQKFWRF